MLPGPHESWFRPAEWIALLRGLAFGYGLKENVSQMYLELAKLHEKDDKVFLFGFSRGAYTARSVGGMIAGFGVPTINLDNMTVKRIFEAYRQPDLVAKAAVYCSVPLVREPDVSGMAPSKICIKHPYHGQLVY